MASRFFTLLLVFAFFGLSAQTDSARQSIKLLSANLGYGIEWPGGDLADRFGQSLSFNAGMEYAHTRKLSFGLDFNYIFGSKVKEDVFAPFRNENGLLIGLNGGPADFFIRERAAYLGLNVGKILVFTGDYSGLKLVVGGGLMYHKLRFVDDSRSIILGEGDYSKGFDRLTRGFSLKQELVYQHHSKDKAQHFNIGFYIIEGFTSPVRQVNFDTGLPDAKQSRTDLLYGLKFTWMLPLYKGNSGNTIKYY
ncbi:MAG: hypothetical protein IPN29_16000 [Saprospiraceae bacterium]|nr:hypothetical protein [Saprospiraceae bacterium]